MAVDNIDTSLLIAAPILQDYLVDKDTGQPLSAGVVTFFQDDQRNVLKNWYYQSSNSPDSSGKYTFSAGPNPMTLSAVGTFVDAQGNDIIPFFYPYDVTHQNAPQPYFVRVENSDGELQFTRANFPFVPEQAPPGTSVPTLDNYIINNEFWRNFGSKDLTTPSNRVVITTATGSTNYFYETLAPSAHDGFSIPDMVMIKDQAGSQDVLTFKKFTPGSPSNDVLDKDITPEYYLQWDCNNVLLGQLYKAIQFPLQLHISTLENETATIVFHAKNNGSTSVNSIGLQILQFCGTGSTNSSFIFKQSFVVGNVWTRFESEPFPLPNADDLIPATFTAGDDALYIEFSFPVDQTFDISFAKPQIYLSDVVPTNQFDTYDQIDPVINGARTGDIRTSLNSFQPFGWVPMNDGTIGNVASHATTRANSDTWPLYNLIWNLFSGSTLPTAQKQVQIYDAFASSPAIPPYVPTTFGASAIADWNANKSISLTRSLGRMMMGIAPGFPITKTVTTTGGNNFTFTSGDLNNVYNGMPITFIATVDATKAPFAFITYYIKITSATNFQIYWDPFLVNPVTSASGFNNANSATVQVIDKVLGQFEGENFGDTSLAYQQTEGYPAAVATGTAAIGTRNPFIYMNFFIKL